MKQAITDTQAVRRAILQRGAGRWAYCEGCLYAAQEDGTPFVNMGSTLSRHPHMRLVALRRVFHVPCTLVAHVWMQREIVWHVERKIHTILAAEHIEGAWLSMHMNQ